jgi:hypothetical protein
MVNEEPAQTSSPCPINYRSALLALALTCPVSAMDAKLATPGQVQVKPTPIRPGAVSGGLMNGANGSLANQFEDLSHNMGPTWSGASFGAGAWGDFNGDGYPDLWQSNHAKPPTLLQNNGDGTFTDVADLVVNLLGPVDSHGAAWADFDGDGDKDLIELVGAVSGTGVGPNQLWRNDNGTLNEVAISYGLDYPTGRGRTPLWLDWNNDGRLDLVTANFTSAASEDKLFTQQPNGTFLEEPSSTGFASLGKPSHFAHLADFDGDGTLDVHMNGLTFPKLIYSLTPSSWTDIADTFGFAAVSDVVDVASGDFDGDGVNDFYFSREPFWRLSQAEVDKNGVFRMDLLSDQQEVGLVFRCRGPIEFDLDVTSDLSNYFIGEAGITPTSHKFTLSHKDDFSGGFFPRTTTTPGIYIGREWDSETWVITMYAPVRSRFQAQIRSLEPFDRITPFGFLDGNLNPDAILDQSQSGWSTQLMTASAQPSASVVTGDFDNDMDLDIYVVRSGTAVNLGNRLYENDGTGQFTNVPSAGGARGVLTGVGDCVSTVDYDHDGFLDLYVTNGRSHQLLAESGQHQLFHNTANSNHWLEIDLVGTTSNIEGIGARVVATAGGVTQSREQGGGIHRWTQNHSRLHFGMGANNVVDTLTIHWPSGTVQILNSVSVDQIMTITEP